MSIEVKFFKNTKGSEKLLGGGYIKTNGIQVRYNVWKNDKMSSGFVVQLPSRKVNDRWIDDVELYDKEVRDHIYSEVEKQLNGSATSQTSNSSNQGQQTNTGPAEINTGAQKDWNSGPKAPF